jgi:hypothetical protein
VQQAAVGMGPLVPPSGDDKRSGALPAGRSLALLVSTSHALPCRVRAVTSDALSGRCLVLKSVQYTVYSHVMHVLTVRS